MKVLTMVLALAVVPCANGRAAEESEQKPTPPKEREYSYAYDMLHNSLVRPLTRALDPALLVRKVSNHPRQAANVDADDQVRLPSTWWQPRIGFRPVTVDQMLRGPGANPGPARGRLKIIKAKSQGVTPGFQVEDSKGQKFLLKFDSPGSPDLTTGAEVIGTYLFWAAGYNVPENSIATFRIEDLEIDKDAVYTNAKGKKQPMTQAYLDELMKRVARQPDGGYRCVASKLLKGKPLGPFQYRGRRTDDPEDLIPHELRRELRGLWTLCALVNHADVRGPNSLDMWVTENDRSFVRHYLIDFGSVLGSGAAGPRSWVTGTEYYVDFQVMGRQLATAGLMPFQWEAVVDPHLPSVGYVEAEVFDPESWRPDYPNPAFDDRTLRDIRWGARIVAAFTDAHIDAAVDAARYFDPRASEYLKGVLKQRRDKLVAFWLGPQTPALRAGK